jgi:hypothetical protein
VTPPASRRDDFVTPWVAWDIVRTLASTAAFGSLAWALVLRGRMGRTEQPQPPEGMRAGRRLSCGCSARAFGDALMGAPRLLLGAGGDRPPRRCRPFYSPSKARGQLERPGVVRRAQVVGFGSGEVPSGASRSAAVLLLALS